MIKDNFSEVFKEKSKVMFVFSHPDDAEVYAGGTISRLLSENIEVCLVKMTLGNKGCQQQVISESELSKIRMEEDTMAAKILGVKAENNIYLDFNDGEIENNLESIGKIVKVIRHFKPDLVVTHNPEHKIIRFAKEINWVNHRDHVNTGNLVVDAIYPYSRDLLFFPSKNNENNSHTVNELLFVDYFNDTDIVCFDVTDYLDTKIKALAAHSSQYSKSDAEESAEFMTKFDDSKKRYEKFRYTIID